MDLVLMEKYRPREFEDVIGIDPIIPEKVKTGSPPNFLFIGPPGTGKTTVAKIIINKLGCDKLALDSSTERGISTVRGKIKDFAMTRSTRPGIKIVHLDEFDGMTFDAQNSMRNLMETYASNVRFIMTANYEHKIHDPIKSRCVVVHFKTPKKGEILKYLEGICQKENIKYEQDALKKIILMTYPDIRKAINKIEQCSVNRELKIGNIGNDSKIVDEVVDLLQKQQRDGVREVLVRENFNTNEKYRDLFNDLYRKVYYSTRYSERCKKRIVMKIAEYGYRLGQFICNPEILFMGFVYDFLDSGGIELAGQ